MKSPDPTRALFSILLAFALAAPALAVRPFEDVTKRVGLEIERTEPKAMWVDYDRDGWVDLYVCGLLWRNIEGQRFEGVPGGGRGNLVLWGDFDNDGYRDALNYHSLTVFRNRRGRGFKRLDILPEPINHSIAAGLGDFDNDGWLDIYSAGYETPRQEGKPQHYTPDAIYRNIGGKRFEEVWRTPKGERRRPGRSVATADFDEDGDLDLYISNYRLEPNLLLLNDGAGHFTNVAAQRGVEGDGKGNVDRGHTIGSAWADLDNDGRLDLFVGNFSHAAKYQDRPRFYRNLGRAGDFHFEDVSTSAGLKWVESFSSPSFADFDNDGDLDLYFAVAYGGDRAVLYANRGDWAFRNVTKQAGLGGITVTYASSWADYDNDGWLDLCTGGRLFRNPGGRKRWLKVRLVGDGKAVNRDAVGTQVRLRLGDRILTRQVEGGVGQANQNDTTLHFGLGARRKPVILDIRWPDGMTEQREARPGETVTISRQ